MKARYWVLHYLAGAFLFVLLLGHIFMMHFYKLMEKIGFGRDPLEWESVLERARNVTLSTLYILFLFFALFHGFYGLKNILIETDFGKRYEKIVVYIFWILGIFLFIFGTYTTIKAGGV
ncbi:MAG: hypothetical protein ABIM85_02110 [candidate division WOR-3 bacterium]